jgi:HSP20 family protein
MTLLAKKEHRTWDPFAELKEMSDRLNRAFALGVPFGRGTDGEGQALSSIDWLPSVNISETDKVYMIRADLPEVKKEDVKVSCDKGMLAIEGERKQEKTEDNERFHRVESSYGRFVRTFALPEDADESGIEASYKDGGLTVRVPKAAGKQSKSRQIKVS